MTDNQQVITKMTVSLVILIVGLQGAFATDFYVGISGNDASGNGSQANPWRTLNFACTRVPANKGHIIRLSGGTFVELQLNVPEGVSVHGAGSDKTIIKADPSLYFNPASPGFAIDKFLINISSPAPGNGRQSIGDFTVDGDGKQLHGAVYVKNRSNVLIKGINVQYTNFTGIWLWDVKDSRVTDVKLKNCAWGSSEWCSGAMVLANLERVELDHIRVDEGFGEGIKSLGANGIGKLQHVKIHDNYISVTPNGQWKTEAGGSAPNIAFELWNNELVGCELYNNYIDNTISLVMDQPQFATPKGIQTIRIYNNILDMQTRAKGEAYALEISIHDVEIDHNYILRGKWGIVNWSNHDIKMSNWAIHHNVFYGITMSNPASIVRAQQDGLHNVKFYNNTVEFIRTTTTNLIAIMGGNSENVEVKNNLIINSNTAYNHYPNRLVHLGKGMLSNLQVSNNLLFKQPVGDIPGAYMNNLTEDPKIEKSGARPTPYYLPTAGSPLIDAGVNVGFPFEGMAPDIGAYEYPSRIFSPKNK